MGYAVAELPSGRESFAPDASYYEGPLPADPMRFIEGAPTLAFGVRSEGDYGPGAEQAMPEKRHDDFAAGNQIVWHFGPLAQTVDAYHKDAPSEARRVGIDDVLDVEPVLPGFRLRGRDLFDVDVR